MSTESPQPAEELPESCFLTEEEFLEVRENLARDQVRHEPGGVHEGVESRGLRRRP